MNKISFLLLFFLFVVFVDFATLTTIAGGLFPCVPNDESRPNPAENGGQALSKWLHTPTENGQPKRLCFPPSHNESAAKNGSTISVRHFSVPPPLLPPASKGHFWQIFGGRAQPSADHPSSSSPKNSSSSHSFSEDEANMALASSSPPPSPLHPHSSSDSEKEGKPKNDDDEFEVVVEYVPNKHWNKYTISVKRTDTLATLKDKIREKYTADYNEYGFGTIELVKEFLTDEREPFVMREDVVLWHEDLDEYKTMEQCGIGEGSTVSVFYARRLDKEEYDQGFYIRPWPTPKKIYF